MFCWLTTTVSASLATVKARHDPMLFVLQPCASLMRMGRDAFERSVSPLQNRWNPPPVPEIPTVTFTFDAPARAKSSAPAVVYGPTVDEPSAVIEPPKAFRLYLGFCVDPAIATDATTSVAAAPDHQDDATASQCTLHAVPTPPVDCESDAMVVSAVSRMGRGDVNVWYRTGERR